MLFLGDKSHVDIMSRRYIEFISSFVPYFPKYLEYTLDIQGFNIHGFDYQQAARSVMKQFIIFQAKL